MTIPSGQDSTQCHSRDVDSKIQEIIDVLFVIEHEWAVLSSLIYPCVYLNLHTVKLPTRALLHGYHSIL